MTTALEDLRASFAGRLLTEAAETAPFLTDWRRRWTGAAIAVVQPDTAQDVAAILAWSARHGVPVVPQGGNTGLSGGSVPDAGGRSLLLSLARLNRIRGVDAANDTVTAEAGCTLALVQETARQAGRLFPLSLAAEGSCTIGGNLATNAGGVHVLRYGCARDLCLGLEVVTAEGQVWDGLRRVRKDNSGFDLRHLFIGSEGTLGVITAAVLKLFPRPAAQVVAFAAVTSPAAALALLHAAQARLGADLTAFELLGETCLDLVLRHLPGTRRPLASRAAFYVLAEISTAGTQAEAHAALLAVLEHALSEGWIGDAAVAESDAQAAAFWSLRESIAAAQGAEGETIKHDISVPLSAISAYIDAVQAGLRAHFPTLRLVLFGHLGDGNLHTNLSPPAGKGAADAAWFLGLEEPVNRMVHDIVAGLGGSISAEHGLGVLRHAEAARLRSPVGTGLMRRLKAALDPDNRMNPGKLLP